MDEDPVVREAVEALKRGAVPGTPSGLVGPGGRVLQQVPVQKPGDPFICPRCGRIFRSVIGDVTAPDGRILFSQVPIPVGVELSYLPEDTEPYYTCPVCRIRQQRKGMPKLRRRKEKANDANATPS